MKPEVILALILKRVEERLASLPAPSRGPRGFKGPPGEDGKSVDFSEHTELFKAWVQEFVLTFDKLTPEQIEELRGPRGLQGMRGEPGRSLNFDEHAEQIKEWTKEHSLTYDKLTSEQIESLRGPQGLQGQKGDSGRSILFEDHVEEFKSWAQEFSLTFDKLTTEQIEALKGPQGEIGPKGDSGADGRSFDFEENKDTISEIIFNYIRGKREEYKLNFSDLSDDEREQLRGHRGRDGRDGKNFVFEDHKEYFETLKLKFSDLSDEEKETLKLHFKDLTEDEKNGLKLQFSDLTEEDRQKIRGARGSKGQRGSTGSQGEKGEMGPRGPVGPIGLVGRQGIPGTAGINGLNGRDGKDAPTIIGVEIDVLNKTTIRFVFNFSDGTEVVSDPVKLPASNIYYQMSGGSGGGGGGSGSGTLEFFDDGISIGEASELNFQGLGVNAEKVGDRINVNIDGGASAGIYFDVPCAEDTFDGAIVRMEEVIVTLYMSDWGVMSDVVHLSDTGLDSRAVNALADTYENANVIGVIEEKTAINRCTLRLYGVTLANYLGLDVTDEYYLSDTDPGMMVKTDDAPTITGHILLKVGQPFSPTRLLFSKGERLIRG